MGPLAPSQGSPWSHTPPLQYSFHSVSNTVPDPAFASLPFLRSTSESVDPSSGLVPGDLRRFESAKPEGWGSAVGITRFSPDDLQL